MCYNKESSLSVFLGASAVIGVLWYRNYPNDRFMAIVAFSIVAMQLIEYFMWSDQGCGMMNHVATLFGALLLIAQPLVIILAARQYRNTLAPDAVLRVGQWLYGGALAYYFLRLVVFDRRRHCTRPSSAGHLNWDFSLIDGHTTTAHGFAMWIMYFVPFFLLLFIKDRVYGVAIFAVLFVLLLFTLNKSRYMEKVASDSWRSLWCFLCNSLPLVVVMLGYVRRDASLRK